MTPVAAHAITEGIIMTEYVPTTEEVREDFAFPWSPEQIGDRPARVAAFNRWLDGLIAKERADERASVLAEQGEPEGQRWYAACWQDDNGILNALESDTILREYAEADVKRWRDAEQREEGGRPDLVVLGTKLRFPWLPVEESRTDGSER